MLEGEPEWKSWRKSWPGVWYGVARFFKWLETKAYKMHVRVLLSKYRAYTPCEACGGARLKSEALAWRLGTRENADAVLRAGRSASCRPARSSRAMRSKRCPASAVHDLMLLPIARTRAFFDALTLPAPLDDATELLLNEICTRLGYLCEVGLGYLTLDRQSRTLSGGEVQRINLTTALGTSLVNTLFVLDEPSIGLHPRDMGRVIDVMHRLRDAGNSLVVVEHDPQVMLAADRILDMGPGSGRARRRDRVLRRRRASFAARAGSLTARLSRGAQARRRDTHAGSTAGAAPQRAAASRSVGADRAQPEGDRRRDSAQPAGLRDRRVGLGQIDAGAGRAVRGAAARRRASRPKRRARTTRSQATSTSRDVVLVDQSPIGRTTRSNPASYVGAFDAIRKLFVQQPLAKERGYTAGTFSFNSGNGRCPTCCGNGFEHVEMQFLSDVYLRCPDCNGRRYRDEILEVKLEGRSIADVLDMTVSEALAVLRRRARDRSACCSRSPTSVSNT